MTLERKGVITVNIANMYRNANVKSEVVSQAIIGTTCTVKLNKRGWYNIQLPDTYLGWIPAEAVRLCKAGSSICVPWSCGHNHQSLCKH